MRPVEFALAFTGIRALVPEGSAPTPEQWTRILEQHTQVIGALAKARLLEIVEGQIIQQDENERQLQLERLMASAQRDIEALIDKYTPRYGANPVGPTNHSFVGCIP